MWPLRGLLRPMAVAVAPTNTLTLGRCFSVAASSRRGGGGGGGGQQQQQRRGAGRGRGRGRSGSHLSSTASGTSALPFRRPLEVLSPSLRDNLFREYLEMGEQRFDAVDASRRYGMPVERVNAVIAQRKLRQQMQEAGQLHTALHQRVMESAKVVDRVVVRPLQKVEIPTVPSFRLVDEREELRKSLFSEQQQQSQSSQQESPSQEQRGSPVRLQPASKDKVEALPDRASAHSEARDRKRKLVIIDSSKGAGNMEVSVREGDGTLLRPATQEEIDNLTLVTPVRPRRKVL